MSMRIWFEECLVFRSISSENQYVIYSNEGQVNQCIFCFFPAETSANQVRYSVHIIVVHQGGANTNSTRAFTDFYFFKGAIRLLLEHMLAPVVSDIDICGLELHQGVQMLVNRFNAFPLQWWQNLEGDQCIFGLGNMFGYFHTVG